MRWSAQEGCWGWTGWMASFKEKIVASVWTFIESVSCKEGERILIVKYFSELLSILFYFFKKKRNKIMYKRANKLLFYLSATLTNQNSSHKEGLVDW